jgi:prolyl 4-hydroxylase
MSTAGRIRMCPVLPGPALGPGTPATHTGHMTGTVQLLSYGSDLSFTVSGLLSTGECQGMIQHSESRGYEPAPITTPRGFLMRPDVRSNTRVMYDDPALAARIWERLRPHAPRTWPTPWIAVGLNERFRIYRYEPGQYFRWHFDGAFHRSPIERSEFTVLIYLNDDFEGGTTDFHDGPSVVPVAGTALVFAHAQRHQGAPPTRGRKYVLRTDIMYRYDRAHTRDTADEAGGQSESLT